MQLLKYGSYESRALYVLEFVSANVVRLKKDVWFSRLNSEQISSVERFLAGSRYYAFSIVFQITYLVEGAF